LMIATAISWPRNDVVATQGLNSDIDTGHRHWTSTLNVDTGPKHWTSTHRSTNYRNTEHAEGKNHDVGDGNISSRIESSNFSTRRSN
jgi:hypothetical protein